MNPPSCSEPCTLPLSLVASGRTSVASALAYLDNGVVYVGSKGGDSQLIKLHDQPVTPAGGMSGGGRAGGRVWDLIKGIRVYEAGREVDFGS